MNPILEFRPATEQERIYTYAQSHELNMHTSALHASLHGAATRDPRGGETPMMRLNLPQLAECPASRGMRSNMDV